MDSWRYCVAKDTLVAAFAMSIATAFGCERGAELRAVEKQVAVLRRQDRRHRRTRRRVLDQGRHRLAFVRSKCGDVDQSRDLRIAPGLSDHDTAVRMADENYRTVLGG